MLIELCTARLEDCLKAKDQGFDRIELNADLVTGGLTPTLGLASLVLDQVDLPVVIMLRPRGGGFCYSGEEYEVMLRDLEWLLELQPEAIATGILTHDGMIDEVRMKRIVDRCHEEGVKVVFHRAFDVITGYSLDEAVERLIVLGVDRILTSGGALTALEGVDTLARLNDQYGDQITFVAGAGVTTDNVEEIVNKTGLTELHGSFSVPFDDPTSEGLKVSYKVPLLKLNDQVKW
ncbi:copper homeostasis protein CutC [Dolosicoccus paucivorans]